MGLLSSWVAYNVCGQSPGSIVGKFLGIIYYDWPKANLRGPAAHLDTINEHEFSQNLTRIKVIAAAAATQLVKIESKISAATKIPWDASLGDNTSALYLQKSLEVKTAFKARLTSAGAQRGVSLTEILVQFSTAVRKRRSTGQTTTATITVQYTASTGDNVDLKTVSKNLETAVKSAAETAVKNSSIFDPS